MRKRAAVLISGRGSNMAALIEAAKLARLSGRDRARRRQPSGRRRPEAWRTPPASPPAWSTTGATARTARRSSTPCDAQSRRAWDRVRVPRGIHAAVHALVRAAVGGPHDQHPPVPAARLQGARHPRARARGRGQDPRRDRALRRCRKWTPGRSSCRPPCRCTTTTARRAWRRACSRPSIGSIRWRSKLAGRGPRTRRSTDAAISMGLRQPTDGLIVPDL